MDSASELNQLETKLASYEAWVEHPAFREFEQSNLEEQEKALQLITEAPMDGVSALCVREQTIGHLRGLRYCLNFAKLQVEEIKQEIANLK